MGALMVSVPSHFLCPISLDLMQDPVTLTSGQTFDRCSIRQWLDGGRTTCPVTRQPLAASDLADPIPNHALRRMIHAWCAGNRSSGIDPQPADIPHLLRRLSTTPSVASELLDALRKLTCLALHQPPARRRIAPTVPALSKLLSQSLPAAPIGPAALPVADEVLRLLDLLIDPDSLPASDLQQLRSHEELIMSLAIALLRSGTSESRVTTSSILLRLQPIHCLRRKLGETQGFMAALLDMIREGGAPAKTALELLVDVCAASNRNRICATEAGAVSALSRMLVSSHQSNIDDKVTAETILRGLEVLCHCAEGRAAIVARPATLTIIVKHMTAVSEKAAHHAVFIISLVLKWAPEAEEVKNSALQDGVLFKAIAVAQSAAASETKMAARRLAAFLCETMAHSQISLSNTLRTV